MLDLCQPFLFQMIMFIRFQILWFDHKNTIQWKKVWGKTQGRDSSFLTSCVGDRAIPWKFEHEKVHNTLTCFMDFDDTFYGIKNITKKGFKRDDSLIAEVLKLIQKSQHTQGRI